MPIVVVETVDPGGLLFKSIDPDRLIGCIAYPAATISKPGVIQHIEGKSFSSGRTMRHENRESSNGV